MDRLGRRDGDAGRARPDQTVEAGAEDVEAAVEIDIDHRLEAVGRDAERRGDEIAGLSGDQGMDRPVPGDGLLQGAVDLGIVAHVGARAEHIATMRCQFSDRAVDPFRRAAADRDLGARLGEAVRDPQIDAAGAAGNEDMGIAEIGIGEQGGHDGMASFG